MKKLTYASIVVVLFSASAALAERPNDARYPNLVHSWDKVQEAKHHVQAAEEAHSHAGGLGGHGARAVEELRAAEHEIDEAVRFAEMNARPGRPGFVTQKSPLTSHPDDAKYPNLGDARLEAEWAIRHIEDAMEYHGPIGTLGGHGERAKERLHAALHEINEAERWADAHR